MTTALDHWDEEGGAQDVAWLLLAGQIPRITYAAASFRRCDRYNARRVSSEQRRLLWGNQLR